MAGSVQEDERKCHCVARTLRGHVPEPEPTGPSGAGSPAARYHEAGAAADRERSCAG